MQRHISNIFPRILTLIILIMSGVGAWGADLSDVPSIDATVGTATWKVGDGSNTDFVKNTIYSTYFYVPSTSSERTGDGVLKTKTTTYEDGTTFSEQAFDLKQGYCIGFKLAANIKATIKVYYCLGSSNSPVVQLFEGGANSTMANSTNKTSDCSLWKPNAANTANVLTYDVTTTEAKTYWITVNESNTIFVGGIEVTAVKPVTGLTFSGLNDISCFPGQTTSVSSVKATATYNEGTFELTTTSNPGLSLEVSDTTVAQLFNSDRVVIAMKPSSMATITASVPSALNVSGTYYDLSDVTRTSSKTISVDAQESLKMLTGRMRWTFNSTGGTDDDNNTYITSKSGNGKQVIQSTINNTTENTLCMYWHTNGAFNENCAYNRGGFYQIKTSGKGELRIKICGITLGNNPNYFPSTNGTSRNFIVRTTCSDHVATTSFPFSSLAEAGTQVIRYTTDEERLITLSDDNKDGGGHYNLYYIEWVPEDDDATLESVSFNNSMLNPSAGKTLYYLAAPSEAGQSYPITAATRKRSGPVVTISAAQSSRVAESGWANLNYGALSNVAIPASGGTNFYYLKVVDGASSDYYELVVKTTTALSGRIVEVEDVKLDYSTDRWTGYDLGYTPTKEDGKLKFSNTGWYQFFVKELIPTTTDTHYKIKANIKGGSESSFGVQFGEWDYGRVTRQLTVTDEAEDQTLDVFTPGTYDKSFVLFQPKAGVNYEMSSFQLVHEAQAGDLTALNQITIEGYNISTAAPYTTSVIEAHSTNAAGPYSITIPTKTSYALVSLWDSEWNWKENGTGSLTYANLLQPAAGETNTYYITVEANDGNGLNNREVYELRIIHDQVRNCSALTFSPADGSTFYSGQRVDLTVTATYSDGGVSKTVNVPINGRVSVAAANNDVNLHNFEDKYIVPLHPANGAQFSIALPETFEVGGVPYSISGATGYAANKTFTVNITNDASTDDNRGLTAFNTHKKFWFGTKYPDESPDESTGENYYINNVASGDIFREKKYGDGTYDYLDVQWFYGQATAGKDDRFSTRGEFYKMMTSGPGTLKIMIGSVNGEASSTWDNRTSIYSVVPAASSGDGQSTIVIGDHKEYKLNYYGSDTRVITLVNREYKPHNIYYIEWVPLAVESIDLHNPGSLTLAVGESYTQPYPTVTFTDGTTADAQQGPNLLNVNSETDLELSGDNKRVLTARTVGEYNAANSNRSYIQFKNAYVIHPVTNTRFPSGSDFLPQQLSYFDITVVEGVQTPSLDQLTPVTETTTWNFGTNNGWPSNVPSDGVIKNNLWLLGGKIKSVGSGNVEFANSGVLTNNIPDAGFAFKVNGRGTITVGTTANERRSVNVLTASGFTKNKVSTNPTEFYYDVNEPTVVYVYPGGGNWYQSITWTPAATAPVENKTVADLVPIETDYTFCTDDYKQYANSGGQLPASALYSYDHFLTGTNSPARTANKGSSTIDGVSHLNYLLLQRIERGYNVSFKVKPGANITVYGNSHSERQIVLSTSDTKDGIVAVSGFKNGVFTYTAQAEDDSDNDGYILYYVGSYRYLNGNIDDSNNADMYLAGIKVTYPKNPEWRWNDNGNGTITNLDVLKGVAYNLRDAIYNPYDTDGTLVYTYTLSGSNTCGATITADGILTAASVGSVNVTASYTDVAGVPHTTPALSVQSRSTGITSIGVTSLTTQTTAATKYNFVYPDTYTGDKTVVTVLPESHFTDLGTFPSAGFSITLNGVAMTRQENGTYTGEIAIPTVATGVRLVIKDGRNTIKDGIGGYWGTDNTKTYYVVVTKEGLKVVTSTAKWDGTSWKEWNDANSSHSHNADQSTNYHYFNDKDKGFGGKTLKAYCKYEGLDDNNDPKYGVEISKDNLYFRGAGSISAAGVPNNRVLEFEVDGPGNVYVNTTATGATANRYIQVAYIDTEGTFMALETDRIKTISDDSTPPVILSSTTTGHNPKRVFIYSTGSGIYVKSITWEPIDEEAITHIEAKQTDGTTAFTTFSTTVGAKCATGTIKVINEAGQNVTQYGTFSVSGTDNVDIVVENNVGYIVGEKAGEGIQPVISWTPKNPKYNAPADLTTLSGTVGKGTLTLVFRPSYGEVIVGRTVYPAARLVRADGKDALDLDKLLDFEISNTAIAKASDYGSVEGVKASDTPVTITAIFNGNDDYNAISAADQTSNGSTRPTYTLKVIANNGRRLKLIEHSPDFHSPNMADYWWYDDDERVEEGSDNIRHSNTTPMSRLKSYLSADHRFRIYSTANDEIVNNQVAKGAFLKEYKSWLGFYAQGSAKLTVTGFATTPRVIELYVINNHEYSDIATKDPSLADATLLKTYSVSNGQFTIEDVITQGGYNYYFLKTSVGGVYISTVDWTNSLNKPYLTIQNINNRTDGGIFTQEEFDCYNTIYDADAGTICRYAMDHTTGAVRITDDTRLKIDAWTYSNNNATTGTKYIIPVTKWSEATRLGNLTFRSSDESVAKVDTAGLVIPIKGGVHEGDTTRCIIYVYLTSDEKELTSEDGESTMTIHYGAQRAEIELLIVNEAVDVDFVTDSQHPSDDKVVYEWLYSATSSSPGEGDEAYGWWPQVYVSKHPGWTTAIPKANYTLSYELLSHDGKPLRSQITPAVMKIVEETTTETVNGEEVTTKTGRYKVEFGPNASKVLTEGEQFRVAVTMSSPHYVDQKANLQLTYTKALTIPSVAFSGTGIKELQKPVGLEYDLDGKLEGATINKMREYFTQAEHDASLTFTIPTTTMGLTYKVNLLTSLPDAMSSLEHWKDQDHAYKEDGDTVVIVNFEDSSTPVKVTFKAPKKYKERYLVFRINKSTTYWYGVYKITFFAAPSHDNPTGSESSTEPRTLKLKSNNKSFSPYIYGDDAVMYIHYTTDTSDPTADDPVAPESGITTETNNVYRYVEVFESPDDWNFIDQDGNESTTFSTAMKPDNGRVVVVRVKDESVLYCLTDWTDYNPPSNKSLSFTTTPPKISFSPTKDSDGKYTGAATRDYKTHALKVGTNTEVRLTLGVNGAPIYRSQDDITQFWRGGQRLGTSADSMQVQTMIDGYDYAVRSYDMGKKSDGTWYEEQYTMTANPYTEYNQDVAAFLKENGGLYLVPMSGDFFRFEPEYNGILTCWVRQNGCMDVVQANVQKINKYYQTEMSSDTKYTGLSQTVKDSLNLDIHRLVQYYDHCDLNRRPVYVMDEDGRMLRMNTMPYTNDDYDDINGVVAEFSQQTKFGQDFGFAWQHNWNLLYKGEDYLYLPTDKSTVHAKNKDEGDNKYAWIPAGKENVKFTFAEIDDYVNKLQWSDRAKVAYNKKNIYDVWTEYKKKLDPDRFNGGKRVASRHYDKLMNFYADRFGLDYTKGDKVDEHTPIKEIVFCDNNTDTKHDRTDEAGQFSRYGYECPVTNLVRFRFPVKAGKTYYLTGRGTKEFFSAMKFENDGTCAPDKLTTYELDEDDPLKSASETVHVNDWVKTTPSGTTMNVKLKRKFTAGKWHPIVLPFAVSESRLREIFGDEVMVLMLDTKFSYAYDNPYAINGNHLTFTRHFYQMLYANVPAFIRPTFRWAAADAAEDEDKPALQNIGATLQTTDSEDTDGEGKLYKKDITFNRVTFMGKTIKEQHIGSNYWWVGSYTTTSATNNGNMYYLDNLLSTADGNFNGFIAQLKHNPAGQKMKATRCWIKTPVYDDGTPTSAPIRYVHLGSFEDWDFEANISDSAEEDNFGIKEEDNRNPRVMNSAVYNLSGQKVSDGSTEGLEPGVYIKNGRKFVVK